MKTLFLAPQVPWPLDVGSKIRTYNLLKSYAALGPVTLVCFSQDAGDAQAIETLAATAQAIHVFPFPAQVAPLKKGKLAALGQALQRLPKTVRAFFSSALAAKVAELLEKDSYDVLHVERLFMVENVAGALRSRAARQPLCVLDIDDLESAKARRLAATQHWSSLRKYLLLADYLKLLRYEGAAYRHFDMALVCSKKDRDALQERIGADAIQVFCNGADLGDSASAMPTDDSRTLVFFGALDYHPNEDAALYFANSIFPLIRSTMGDARLVIAGKSPTPALQSLHNGDDIIVRGYVEDKNALFASGTAIVVPIRIGGGTRIKILEAMAAGRPVIATTVGCEGIEATPRVDVIIADSPATFAQACVELMRDAGLRQRIGAAGRELVMRQYRWDSIRAEFARSLRERLGRLPPAALAAT